MEHRKRGLHVFWKLLYFYMHSTLNLSGQYHLPMNHINLECCISLMYTHIRTLLPIPTHQGFFQVFLTHSLISPFPSSFLSSALYILRSHFLQLYFSFFSPPPQVLTTQQARANEFLIILNIFEECSHISALIHHHTSVIQHMELIII